MAAARYHNDCEAVARRREDQGVIECEVFGDGPDTLESNSAWVNCRKTQNNHRNFIPVLEFSEQHIPDGYHHKADLVKYIRALATLTVKLRVSYVSGSRPDGYTFSNYRNLSVPSSGTGWVYSVSPGDGPCPCQKCSNGSPPAVQWWKIEVFTACHVVYDKQEAQKTQVDLYYDEENSKVTTLHGCDVARNYQCQDMCTVGCITHDKELATLLMDAIKSSINLKLEVRDYWKSPLCVVISHPHGQPKRITVGDLVGNEEFDALRDPKHMYTTDTCKGSSGAPVLTALTWNDPAAMCIWPGAGPHSGTTGDKKHNQCGFGNAYFGAADAKNDDVQRLKDQVCTALTDLRAFEDTDPDEFLGYFKKPLGDGDSVQLLLNTFQKTSGGQFVEHLEKVKESNDSAPDIQQQNALLEEAVAVSRLFEKQVESYVPILENIRDKLLSASQNKKST